MIYCLYHHPDETIGLIEGVMKSLQIPFKELRLYAGDGLPRETSDMQGLILMGGPMSVNDEVNYPFLTEEVRLLEQVIRDNKPVLGICLGAQLIAKALGANVYSQGFKELGWLPIHMTRDARRDPLWSEAPKTLDVFHWHGDTFDLPEGAVHLAGTEQCANQAFRWGDWVYGLQFHMEVTPELLRRWMKDGIFLNEARSNAVDVETMLKTSIAAYERLLPFAERFFASYFKKAYARLTLVA